jgi:hypothetical protein
MSYSKEMLQQVPEVTKRALNVLEQSGKVFPKDI